MSIKAVCGSEGQQKPYPPPPLPPPSVRVRSWKGWAGAGGGGWVRNHKPTTSAGNCMHVICIHSCMIHQHHFNRVQNITFILQMLIYDKQLIWETSELGSMKEPVTFTSFCLRQRACWSLGMAHVCNGVRTVCVSPLQQLSSGAGGILAIDKIISKRLNKSEHMCQHVTVFRYFNSTH